MPSLAITLRSAAMYAVLSVLTLVGCDVPASGLLPTSIDGEAGEPTGAVGTTGSSAGSSPTGIALPHRPPLRIASFNIQTFGLSKLQRTQVVDILCDIVRQFDVVAIQEIRSENQNMIPEFVERVNDGGADYDYVIGPRLGRTATYQEQYAYIFDANSVRLDWNSVFTMVDEEDRLHREPLIATFRAITDEGTPFQFTLVNVHTDPDEVAYELRVLNAVYRALAEEPGGEDDVIMLGDFNAAPEDAASLSALGRLTWAIHGIASNTRGSALYDNLAFHPAHTVEFTGNGGVLNFAERYRLSLAEALDVSDHLPVWAEFSRVEHQTGVIAGRDDSSLR